MHVYHHAFITMHLVHITNRKKRDWRSNSEDKAFTLCMTETDLIPGAGYPEYFQD